MSGRVVVLKATGPDRESDPSPSRDLAIGEGCVPVPPLFCPVLPSDQVNFRRYGQFE
jgi:hypothetical protein